MSENTALIPQDVLNLPSSVLANEEAWGELITTTSFLPRLQLFGGNSGAVKAEKITQGRYGIPRSKENIDDLGKEVPCLPLSFKYKAMIIDGSDVTTFEDPKSAEFIAVRAAADEDPNSGNIYGIEFLLWLADHNQYVTFYLNSKSSRRVAPELRALIGKRAVLKVHLAQTKKYSWHVPVITVCSTPFPVPSLEEIKAAVDKFNAPPEVKVKADNDKRER